MKRPDSEKYKIKKRMIGVISALTVSYIGDVVVNDWTNERV